MTNADFGKLVDITIMAIRGRSSDMMATEHVPGHHQLQWRMAEVRNVSMETHRVRSLFLSVADWPGHNPGQHVDVRLTAEGGYQTQRSYSISSPPEDQLVSITVERVNDGEVSPYLVDELRIGDRLELRGPIGGHFVWAADRGNPLCLIAGGTGIAPLMAILRHLDRVSCGVPTVLIYSSRSLRDIIYRRELEILVRNNPNLRVVHTLTRDQSREWVGYRGRIDRALLTHVAFPAKQEAAIFICGPSAFVENVSVQLIELGHAAQSILTERFGPSGG
jgi:ferredoxin-NADP reductase